MGLKTTNLLSKKNIIEILPLTPLQEGMLFHSLFDKDSQAYVQQMTLHVSGELDIDCLAKSWDIILERHEVLRTAFQYKKSQRPVQVILAKKAINFKYQDLTDNPTKQQELIEKYRLKERTRRLDLAVGETMRLMIIKIRPDEHIILWTFHHILMDGWCSGIIHNELYSVYQSLKNNEAVTLPPSIEYRKYIHWLQKQDAEKSREFWQGYLKSYDKAIVLPNTSDEANKSAYDLGIHWINIEKERISQLNRLTVELKVTANSLINAIWSILLSRYNDTNDVVFGSTLSIRPSEIIGIESVVGLMINTIPFRAQIADNDSFSKLVKNIHDASVEMRPHSHYSLADIQALSEVRENLFRHILVFENLPKDKLSENSEFVPGIKIISSEMYEQTHYDLELTIFPGEELDLRFSYNRNVYTEDDMTRTGEHFQQILRLCLDDPAGLLSDIEILPVKEKKIIIDNYSGSTEKTSDDRTILELIDDTSQKYPEKIAISSSSEELSYQQLTGAANYIAKDLIRISDCKNGDLIALIIPRSKWMILGVISVWKTGAAYVPIDPDYPAERIRYILDQTSPKAILTHSDVIDQLKDIQDVPVIAIDANEPECASLLAHAEASFNTPVYKAEISNSNLAYVFYTSGSTGTPKGVMITHKNLSSFVPNLIDRFGLDSDDTILAMTTYTFDISVLELFLPLTIGMTVFIADIKEIEDPAKIQVILEKHKCNTLQITPSHLRVLLENLGSEFLANLKTLLVGGEPIPKDLYRTLSLLKGTKVFNVYGPTETTIWSTTKKIDDEMPVIGSPLINETMYILDRKFRPVPIGVEGDIYIGGEGVGRGYYNNPDLTEKAFFNNPFGHSEQMYLTGDRGKFLSNGDIEFLGRADHQIKVRGFRVEPGEIEHHIIEFPGITGCIVVSGTGLFSEDLIAYYTGEEIDSIIDVKTHLKKFLPDYMIPTQLMHLDQFPLMSSGKINRKLLPSPSEQKKRQVKTNASRKANRQKLEELYRLILNRDDFSWDDDFFDLGGHSLKAMRLAAAIRKEFMIDLELQDLFNNPTLNQLYQFVASQKPSGIPWIEVAESQEDYPLSHSQKQIWTIDQLKSGSVEYNMPSAIQVDKEIDPDILRRAITKLTERHEILRTSFIMRDNEPRQVICDSVEVDLEVIECVLQRVEANPHIPDITRAEARTQYSSIHENGYKNAIEQIRSDVHTSFNLTAPPLFRCKLFRISDKSSILYLNIHHIIADEQSIDVFFEELLILYKSCLSNESYPLGALRVQYKDYSDWQQQFINSPYFRKYEKYWLNQFKDKPAPLNLPTDFPRSDKKQDTGQTVNMTIDDELGDRIREYVRNHKVTPFMYLLSAVNVLLYKYTTQSDIVIGLPTSLRIHPDLENQIGFYVNVLAVRNKLEGWATFPEFLKKVKQNTTRAHDNRLYPYDLLIEMLGLDRYEDQNSLFNVMVVFEEGSDDAWWESDYQIKPIPIEEKTSKFDLVFQFKWTSGKIRASINFNDSLFTRDTIERILSHFIELNQSILDDDQLSLDRLAYIPDKELDLLVNHFNRHRISLPDKTVVDIIEDRVRANPDKLAVSFKERKLTYSELNSWSNDIAHTLIESNSIHPDDIIAVLMNRSDAAIASILAVVKTGAAFLPLDGDLPEKRVRYILKDSECKILLKSDEITLSNFDPALNVVDIESISRSDSPNPERHISGSDLAYVIYTSGTTGKPKGVMVEHHNILTTVMGQGNRMGFTGDDTMLQFSSLSFDASVMEILLALVFGAHQVPIQRDVVLDPNKFEETLEKYKITAATLPPGYIASLRKGCLKNLRILASVAEAARTEDAEYYSRYLNFYNAYGPTETAVCSAFYSYDPGSNIKFIPIGKPLPNTKVYILDKNQQPVPIGVPGELYLGGDNVARGYFKSQELTEERFIPDPYTKNSRSDTLVACAMSSKYESSSDKSVASTIYQGKLFKSGDIGKWLPDGNILYLGRADNMVKIRGFRVELSEIESTIDEHPDVIRSVVITRSKGNTKALVVYLIEKKEMSIEDLKSYLRERLPLYMVPDWFVTVESFPLTDNGKIDTEALPDTEEETRITESAERSYSDTENHLIKIWRNILNIETIDIDTSFFDLGGSSLNAIQLIHTIQSELSITVSTKELFTSPTVRQFAKYVDNQRSKPKPETAKTVDTPIPKVHLTEDRKRLHITDQSLEDLIESNRLPRLDAVALGYFTESVLTSMRVTEEEFLSRIEDVPILSDVIETHFGTIGYVILPRFTGSMYQDKDKLLSEIKQVKDLSEKLGAKSISLTGLIPSATDYGKDIVKYLNSNTLRQVLTPDATLITTGHATTIGTILLQIEKTIMETGRSFQNENVGILGLGSVGSVLALSMLQVFPHPKKIILCDLYNRREYLEDLKDRIKREYKFKGQVDIQFSQPYPPDQFYDSSFYIGATNVAEILQIEKLMPGSIVIDDSGPHCFHIGEAIKRIQDKSDILITEGGVLFTPENLNVTSYVPEQMQNIYRKNNTDPYEGFNSRHLTGCVLSCLLTLKDENITPTIGIPLADDCVENYTTLKKRGFTGGEFHISNYSLESDYAEAFRKKFQ
ncbi:MAG: amino acid adenylation domain-containing protein [Candidatus Hatepunaea meridiana]|nr:amino acid adenylation domain-containing protein [Candidatus Hatepunaea meridiana]